MNWLLTILTKISVSFVEWYLKKMARDEQSRKDLIAFNEIMHRKGLISVKLRLDAANQIDRVKEMWSQAKEEFVEDDHEDFNPPKVDIEKPKLEEKPKEKSPIDDILNI